MTVGATHEGTDWVDDHELQFSVLSPRDARDVFDVSIEAQCPEHRLVFFFVFFEHALEEINAIEIGASRCQSRNNSVAGIVFSATEQDVAGFYAGAADRP